MDAYKAIDHYGDGMHTCRITLMDDVYVGHVTFKIGGNCKGSQILEAALEFLEDPARYESDCDFLVIDDVFYSVVLKNGDDTLEIGDLEYEELCDRVVAVEIIDYRPRNL